MCSRHIGVQFFDIWTSKKGPSMRCFLHFDLKMCFAPHRRAIFRHPDFKKWSEHAVLCTFLLHPNFKKRSGPEVFYTFWLENASRHSGVQFFLYRSAPAILASLLFDPPEPRTIAKNTTIRDIPDILRVRIFLVTLLSSDATFFWLFFLSLLFNCPYCRKLNF